MPAHKNILMKFAFCDAYAFYTHLKLLFNANGNKLMFTVLKPFIFSIKCIRDLVLQSSHN